ncbi:MAG: ImmA/IrrE family metallo-endopeptidase [Candidatus Paceibacterota bacterium]|jgi:hypothetical protein
MAKAIVVPGKSKIEIDNSAVSFLSEFQPTAIKEPGAIDVADLFEIVIPERYRIKTGYTDLSPLGPGVLGYTDAALKISFVDSSLSDAEDTPTRRLYRSTVAHEMKHCIKHVQILNIFRSICKDKDDVSLYRREKRNIKPYEDPEWQAWIFAGALLMPRHHILGLYNGGYSIEEMANIFDVNPAFVRSRLRKLDALK